MKKFIRIGVDLAKNYFQVHALESENGPAVTRKLKRSKMHEFFSQIEPCLIGMEACGSAHYWARELAPATTPWHYDAVEERPSTPSSAERTMQSTLTQSAKRCPAQGCALCRSRARNSKRCRCCTRRENCWSSSGR